MTNADLEARLKALSPIQKVTLCQNVVARLSVDGDAVQEAERHISTEIRRSEGYAWLIQQASNDPSAMLDEGKSAEIAEVFLLAAADDPQMSPVVKSELDVFRDEKQLVLATLAVGFAASMVIIAATSSFHYEDGKLTISKSVASADLVKAALMVIARIAPA
jgi:hypothetical protein